MVDGRAARPSGSTYHGRGGFLSGSIETPGHTYALRSVTDTLTQFYEIDTKRLPPCGGVRHPVIDANVLAAASARRARHVQIAGTSSSTPSIAAAGATDAVEIHLMMLYTQAVKTTLTGDARVAALQSEFDAAVAKMNAELAASQVNARVKRVKIAETTYDETASAGDKVQDDALTALLKRVTARWMKFMRAATSRTRMSCISP